MHLPVLRIRCALAALFLLLCAAARSQPVSLSLRQASFEEALLLIEAQGPWRFVYVREELYGTHPLSLETEAAPLDSVLLLLFRNQPLTYSRLDDFIVIKRKSSPPPEARRPLRGVVVDEQGHPVAGASLLVKGRGVAADPAGRFLLQDCRPTDTLLVSAVGFHPAAVAPKDAGVITLRRTDQVLDETVVTGYGYTTRRRATGSFARVRGRALTAASPAVHPLAALQGRVTGLWLRPSSGLPDAPLTVQLRGVHSLQSGTAPLFLVDGVPFLWEGTPLSQRSGLQAAAPLHPLHGEDIESIEVLRDGDATAIYGSRGSGGVVLITTRIPQPGKGSGQVTLRRGWSYAGRTPEYLSTPRYLELRQEAFKNDGVHPTPALAPDLTVWDPARDQRWKDRLIGGAAPSLELHLRYGGGRQGTAYSVSGNYSGQGTVYPGTSGSTGAMAAARLAHHGPGGRWHLSGAAEAAATGYRLPSRDLTAAIQLPPNMYAPYDAQGRLRWSEGGYRGGNPLAALHQPFRAVLRQAGARLATGYRPAPRLEVSLRGGAGQLHFHEELLVPVASQDPALLPRGSSLRGSRSVFSWVWEPAATWQLPGGRRLSGTLTAGATLQQSRQESELVTAQGYLDDALLGQPEQAPQLSAAARRTLYRYSGTYARLSLEHRSRYLLQVTGRRDGSSRFGPGRQHALFAAVGGGWIFSREAPVRSLLPWLTHGKLRASWGTTGNDRIGEHVFRDAWSPAPYPYGGGSAWKAGSLYNPDYGWEVTRKWEAALEGGACEDRLLFSIAFYHHRSGNLIIRYPLPAQTGFPQVLRNFAGVVENHGVEGEVTLRSRRGVPLEWSAGLQLTVPRNRLASFPGLHHMPYATGYVPGKPLNIRIGYRYRGVDPQSGLYLFEDVNGDNHLDAADQQYLGTTDPRYYGSFLQELKWKGWALSVLVYFVRQQGLDPVYRSAVAPGDLVNMPLQAEDRWREGRGGRYQRATQDVRGVAYFPGTALVARSSAVLTDASFLRLREVQLSRGWEKGKKHVPRGMVFLSGVNLLTLTRYPGDPEVQSTMVLPPLRTLETGLRLFF